MIERARWTVAGAVLTLLTVTGCTGQGAEAPDAPEAVAPTAEIVEVTVADVVGVLTLPGTVTQGAVFDVHGGVRGRVTLVEDHRVQIREDSTGATVTITAPDGTRMQEPRVAVDDVVTPGMAILSASAVGFSVQASLAQTDLLRFVSPPLGARAQIKGASAPFDCPLRDSVPTTANPDEQGAGVLLCRVPDDAVALAGMEATLVIQLERAEQALVLPVEAVAGTVDNGSVNLVGEGGQTTETPVGIGTTDGVRIVITEGVSEGDRVYVPAPGLIGDR